MRMTREVVRDQLLHYLNREISLAELVDWAENAMAEGEFEEADLETLRDIGARLGLADVQNFGLTWDDCYEFIEQLGYHSHVTVLPAEA